MKMAGNSLSEFFDAYYHGPQKAVLHYKSYHNTVEAQISRNLRKAVMRVAAGSHAQALRQAMRAWEPTGPRSYFYTELKRTALATKPQRLTPGQITTVVTRVRKELETWLDQ